MIEKSGKKQSNGKAWAFILVSIMIGSAFMSIIGNVAANRGGSDAYGYEWTDSKSPSPTIAFNWIEINLTGTNSGLNGGDVSNGPYPIGFNFPFYGNTYSQMYLNSKGQVLFDGPDFWWVNDPIPNMASQNNFIAAYWDDLRVNEPIGQIYYQTFGSAPNRQLVAEWSEVRPYSGDLPHLTFEIILNETGNITMQYLKLSGYDGASATVGLENATGQTGCQYSYNQAVLSDNMAIRFSLGPFGIGPDQSKSGMTGTTVSYDLTVANRQAFADSFDLICASVRGWSVSFYDSTGTVLLTDTNGDPGGYPDTGNIPAGGAFSFVAKVSIPLSPSGIQDTENVTAISFSNNALSRSTTLITNVIPAQFNPPHADYGLDTNADGLYDYLVVDVCVNVDIAGSYYIVWTLRDNLLDYIDNDYNWTLLSVGVQTVELRFEGSLINAHGVNGPYSISLSLRDNLFNLLDADTYLTNAYAWSQFIPPSSFNPPHSDYGLDTNADGLFDYLVIDVSVNITSPGFYQIDGILRDNLLNFIGSAYNWTYLNTGIQTVELRFVGWRIYNHGVNGPYDVSLNLRDQSFNVVDTDTYLTSAYAWTQFPPASSFHPPHDDHGEDTNGNGLYDYLVVDVSVNITTAGWYDVLGSLYDGMMNYITQVGNYTYLSAGMHTVELRYASFTLYNHGWDGTYGVSLNLVDYLGNTLDTDSYITNSYLHTQFEPPGATFVPPYSDHGEDTNANGLYDNLVVEVPVNVTTAGWYTISGNLMFSTQSNHTYLSAGSRLVELRFSASVFSFFKMNTTYFITLHLYNAMNQIDSDFYTTNYYTYDQFEPSPVEFSPPHSDHGVDIDSDGLYEYLAVDEVVNVTVAGYYDFLSLLFDGAMMTEIALASNNSVYLPSGTHTVQMLFPAGSINSSGINGPYAVEMVAVDPSSGNLIAVDLYMTAAYAADQFEAASASFELPINDYGLDANGNGKYDYLVVNVTVNVLVPGTYGVTGALSDNMLGPIITVTNTTYLAAGLQTVELRFDGNAIYNSGDNAPYFVNLELRDASNMLLDGYLYFISGVFYSWNDFEGAGGGDTTPPTTNIIVSPPIPDGWNGWYVSKVNVTLIANDNPGGSGVDHTYYRTQINGGSWGGWNTYAGQFSLAANGTYAIEYHSVDHAGNDELPHDVETVKIDRASPTTASHSFNYTLMLSPIDNAGGSGVNKTWYRVDNVTWLPYTGRLSVGSTGTFFIEYYSVDNAGNSETVRNFTLPIHDNKAPITTATLLGTAGLNGWFTSAVNVLLAATDDPDNASGVNNTFYRIDGGSWKTYSGTQIPVTSEGTHTIEFYSKDFAGNTEATKSATVKIDTVAPTLTIDQAMGAEFNTSDIVISWTASDATSGLDHFEYSLDGAAFIPCGLSTHVNLANLTAGSHNLTVRAIDGAGNVAEKTLQFNIVAAGISISGLLPWLLLLAVAIAAMLILFLILSKRRRKDGDSATPPQMPPQAPPQNPPLQTPPPPPPTP
jgi:hypothetical protein